MKVCLVGITGGPADEGMKNTNVHLAEELSRQCSLLVVDPGELFSLLGWRRIRAFRPDIIHYLHGPTIRSLLRCRALKLTNPKAKVFMSAPRPRLGKMWSPVLPLMRPDFVFAYSSGFYERLVRVGIPTRIIYPGVDTEVFKPIDNAAARESVRKSIGVDAKEKVVLHVGNISVERGVSHLARLQERMNGTVRFVVVGSLTNKAHEGTVQRLNKSGVRVIIEFIGHVEEIYQCADAYVFPGLGEDAAIDLPLSVLEAMATNLPIVSTRFGALPQLFPETPFFRYYTAPEEMEECIHAVLEGEPAKCDNRRLVLNLGWKAYAQIILSEYELAGKWTCGGA